MSRICKDLDADVAVLRTRTLGHQPFVYVWLDATYVHVRENRRVVSKAVVIATGLRQDGRREVLGVDLGDSENETFWTEFLGDLNARGLGGVKLVISDAHAGLVASIRRSFQGASWQRCRVHAMRNMLSAAPHQQRQLIASLIRTIFVQPDHDAAVAQLRAVVDQLDPTASVIRLVGALLVEINDEMIAADRRYIAAANVAEIDGIEADLQSLPAASRD